jgi:hypothetical protein
MARFSPAVQSFNAGEFSRRLEGRSDLDKYAAACRTCDNFVPTVQGAAVKRSGTRFVHPAKAPNKTAVLIPFRFSVADNYVLEFGDLYMRVFRDGEVVLEANKTITGTTNATPVVVTSNAHGFSNGNQVLISGTGIAALDGRFWQVAGVTANTFELAGSTAPGSTSVTGTVARVYEIVTPYAEAELRSINAGAQIGDVVYLAHPNHPPHKLSRTGHTAWTLTEIAFTWQAFAPENLDTDDAISASAATGSSITLTSPNGHFTAGMVGTYVRLREEIEANHPEWTSNENFPGSEYAAFIAGGAGGSMDDGDTVQFEGRVYELLEDHADTNSGFVGPIHEDGVKSDGRWDWRFINHGSGYARITAFTSAFRVTATVVKELPRSVVSPSLSIASITGAIAGTQIEITAHGLDVGDKVFVFGVAGTIGATLNNKKWTVIQRIDANNFRLDTGNTLLLSGSLGTVVQYRWDGKNSAAARVYPTLHQWAFGAWSAVRGYPKAVVNFEDRLGWLGTESDPTAAWFSRTSRYEDHRTTSEDDSALLVVLNAEDPIEWAVAANKSLRIGTAGSEFASLPSTTDEPLTPGNVATRIVRAGSYGSRAAVPPVRAENVVLFPQRAGRKIRELSPVLEEEAPDLTILAEHATRGIVRQMVFQAEPDRIVWVLLEDGSVRGFAYERVQQVTGWFRMTIGGTDVAVESLAVIPHPDGDRDQLWLFVRRTIAGSTFRYIEILEPLWESGDVITDAVFVDSCVTYSGAPATAIGGLLHLEGQSVQAFADGIFVGTFTVVSGSITIPAAASLVQIGLGYTAILETMRIEGGRADGTAQGKKKRIEALVARLDDTGEGLRFGPDASRATEPVQTEEGREIAPGTLYSDDTRALPFPGGHERAGRIAFRHATPSPCTIVALFPEISVAA